MKNNLLIQLLKVENTHGAITAHYLLEARSGCFEHRLLHVNGNSELLLGQKNEPTNTYMAQGLVTSFWDASSWVKGKVAELGIS